MYNLTLKKETPTDVVHSSLSTIQGHDSTLYEKITQYHN